MPRLSSAIISACFAATTLSACAAPYTGPVEVTRFVGDSRASLGQGTIRVVLGSEMANDLARSVYVAAVSQELARIGYTVLPEGSAQTTLQTATIRTSRQPIAGIDQGGRGPVSVGVGGQTGGWNSGVGMGVGINLGGGQSGPAVNTELSVRIDDAAGQSLWEGRSQIATAMKSPYTEAALGARTLASGLFRDFPGGNGLSVTIKARDLQPSR
jgi:hypothetical protein